MNKQTQIVQGEEVLAEKKSQNGGLKEEEGARRSEDKKTKKVVFDPRHLFKPFDRVLPLIIQQPEKKKRKATNIPKFIIKVFNKDLPVFPTAHHNQRLSTFAGSLNQSKTRFHMIELFGMNEDDPSLNCENEINRQVLRRVLHRNYENVLANTHIQHKRLYLMFSKKVLLRLNQPNLIGNIEV